VHFRMRGFRTYLTGTPWSEGFMRAYGNALHGLKPLVGVAATLPGSFNALVVAYYRSPEFLSLRASTRSARRGIIERLLKEHGHKRLSRLERSHIMGFVGAKYEHPSAANNLLKVLKLLLNYEIDFGMLSVNPALGVKWYKIAGDWYHTWSKDQITTFDARHPKETTARLALAHSYSTRRRRCEAGLPDCTAHGLRKASATRLANAGCSANQIASITGHASLVEVARYKKKADNLRWHDPPRTRWGDMDRVLFTIRRAMFIFILLTSAIRMLNVWNRRG
jgi:hypothetical protein